MSETSKIYRLSTGRKVRVASDKEAAFLEKHPNAEFIMVEQDESAVPPPPTFDTQARSDATNVQIPGVGKFSSPVINTQGENLDLGLSSEDTSSDSQKYNTQSNGIKSTSNLIPDWLVVDWLPELDKDKTEVNDVSTDDPAGDVVVPEPWDDPVETTTETNITEEDPYAEYSETFQNVAAEVEGGYKQPVVITNESVASPDAIESNELLPDWLKEAGVYSLIEKHKGNVNWTNTEINSEEEFWAALKPYTTTTTEAWNPKASKFQTQSTTTTHYWIGNVEKAQNPELYAELYTLYETKLLVEDIRKRDVFGTYVGLPGTDVLSTHFSYDTAGSEAYISIDETGMLPEGDRYAEDFNVDNPDNYTITDYENFKNTEALEGFQIVAAEAQANLQVESQKSLEKIQLALTEQYLPDMKVAYGQEIAELTESFKVIQDEIIEKFRDDFALEFEGLEPTQDEMEEWEDMLKVSLKRAQEAHFADLNKIISTEINKKIKLSEEYKAWEKDLNAQWEVISKDLEEKYLTNFKFEYSAWEEGDLDNMSNWLQTNYNFMDLAAPDKVKLLNAAFNDYVRKNNISSAQESDMKDEFFAYFYDQLSVRDGQITQFYLKGVAEEILRSAEIDRDKASEQIELIRNNPEIFGPDLRSESPNPFLYNITATFDPAATEIEKRTMAIQAITWANDVLSNPEKYEDTGFWAGFTSHNWFEYIPGLSGSFSMNFQLQVNQVQDKLQKGQTLTQGEENLLQIAAIKQQSEGLVSDLSLSYNAGSMLAHSVPFIGEFILTRGAFTGVKTATQKTMRNAIARNISSKARVSKDGSKILFGKPTGGAALVDKMVEPVSMLLGVTAQTLANPIRIAENTVSRMSDEMLFAFTTDADPLLQTLSRDVYIAGTKEGDEIGLKEGEGFGEALAKGFGLTWAEIFTENLGAYFPALGGSIKSKLFKPDGMLGNLVNNNEFWSRIALGRLLRRYGFTRSEQFVNWSKNAAGWNGFVGEFMEEVVNMPMSNLISGDAPLFAGLAKIDPLTGEYTGGVDWRNLGTVALSVGAGAGMFSGGAVIANKVMGNKAPAYYVNNIRFKNWKDANAYLKTMKSKGLLNADLDIEIQNDFIAYNQAADYLKKNGINEDIIKVNKKGTLGDQITATEIEIQNELGAEQRKELDDIDKKLEALQSQLIEEEQSNKSKRSKSKAVKAIQSEINNLNNQKNSIIKPIVSKIESKKSEKVFKDTLGQVEKINAALRKAGKKNVKITRRTTQRGARNIAMQRMFGIKIDGISKDGTVRYVDAKTGKRIPPSEVNEEVMNAELDAAQISHGYFIPGQGNKKGEIIINQEAALNRRGENVAAHEFLHFFLNEALEQSAEMKLALGTVFQQYVNNIDPRAVRNSEFRKRLAAYSKKSAAVQAEEAMTLFLDAMANGELQYNETVFTKLGDILRHIFNRMGITIKLETGKDVYNFLKDFNKNIQKGELSASMIKAMEGTIEIGGQVEAVADMVSETVEKNKEKLRKELSAMIEVETGDAEPMSQETFEKLLDVMSSKGILFSKDVTDEVNELGNMGWDQESWESQGANYALETMITEQMLDGLIAAKLKFKDEKGSAEIETFISDVYAKLSTHVKNFNKGLWGTPQQNDSLYGWINSQLANKANEVWNAAQKPEQEKWAANIDATTSEGAPLFQIAAEEDSAMARLDEITLNEEQKVIYSQFRQDLGLNEDMMNVVRDVVVQTFGRRLPKVGTKEFKLALMEAYRNELKTPIQDMMGKGASYDAFLEEYMETVYAQLSKETLIQMERRIPEELRIFTRNRRITKPTEVDALIEQGLLPKDTNRLSGPNFIEKLPYPGTEKIMAFFRGKNMQEVLGYKKGTSTLGTRKDGLAKYIGQELAFDATSEVLGREQVRDRFLEIIEMGGQDVVGNEIAIILKQIDRQPGIMFSKASEADMRRLADDAIAHGYDHVFPDGQLSSEYSNVSEESWRPIERVFRGNNLTEDGLRFKTAVKLNEKIDEAIKEAFKTQGNLRVNLKALQNLHRDAEVIAKELGPEFMEIVGYDVLGYVYRVMDSAAEKKDGSQGAFHNALNEAKTKVQGLSSKDISGDVRVMNKGATLFKKVIRILESDQTRDAKLEQIEGLQDEIDAANTANIAAAVAISKSIVNLARSGKISMVSALNFLQIQTGIVKGLRGLSRLDLIEVRDGSQSHKLGKDHPLYNEAFNFYKKKGTGKGKNFRELTNEEAEKKAIESLGWKGEHLAPNSNTMLELVDLMFQSEEVTDEQIQSVFKDHSQALVTKYLADVMDDAGGANNTTNFERIKFLDQSHQDVMSGGRGRGYTDLMIDRAVEGVMFSKSVDKSNAAKLKQQQNARLTYNENTERRGMSTFDFDETLIIEGENFITATHPTTGEVIKISSGNWPLEGPKMAAQGYQFDFSDFVNVRGGIEGPLLQKMRNQIEKYGADNVFVLTARQQESATAIYEWLKTKGINLPFENITGLGKSEGSAKAEWMLGKYAEGYNDMYFVDDALPNVEAVKKVLDALDIKSKVVQARIMFSKDASKEFNEMLERNKDVDAKKTFSAAEARRRGAKKGRFEFFIPPSAEDFKGLMYKVLGRGTQGEQDLAWVEENLITPYAKGIRDYNSMKQKISSEYRALRKKAPSLKKKVPGTSFSVEQAIRVYLFDKAGYEVPGLAKSTKTKLINHVNSNSGLINFAGTLSKITRTAEGYMEPTEFWDLGSIASDMRDLVDVQNRGEFLAEWQANRDAIFSEENLNKLEATFGTNYRDALENMLYRMETGRNRTTGSKDKVVNSFLDWINGSVGAVMFFNTRSAVLQTISTVNFIDFEDNNIFKASAAFANAPQFWKDFAYIFNSDTLKQRRSGLQMDVNAEELTDAFNTGKGPKAVIQYLLQIGFTPTQLADSFAISLGGASYYRNKVKANIKRGMNQQEAEAAAWLSFQEKSEETQQSSRPDFISQQQAGVLGRLVLAWQNTPMQMTRLMKKATLDLVNGRGDVKANVSKIIYYGVMQNIIFGALQSGLMWTMFGDDEEEIKKKELRVANGVLDTLLRGTGVYGAAASTIKNVLLQWDAQRKKGFGQQDYSKISQDIVNLSPPLGSKHRKLLGAVKTYEYNEEVISEMDYGIDNPMWSVAGNVIEAITNIPAGRLVNKANNIDEAINGNMAMWQRAALLLGWNKWDIGIKDADVEQAKTDIKERKEQEKAEEKEMKKLEREVEKGEEQRQLEEDALLEQDEERESGVPEKELTCAAITSKGVRCGRKVLPGQNYCTIHEKVEQQTDEVQCSHIKKNGKRCKMKTKNKSGKCYYHD